MKITTFKEYQENSIGMKLSLKRFLEKHPNLPNDVIELLAVTYDGLGLGEAGEVQGKIKKIIRDDGGVITEEHKEAIKSEIGDTLWYLTSMCDNLGFTLEDAANYNLEKLRDRHARKMVHGSGDNR
jgi:NTP pyrophosphatase (non-canonical NTP hydrolase)